jgi:hypothetical protein
MGALCGGGAAAPKTNKERNAEANKQAAGTRLAGKGNYKSPKTGFQQVKDDIQMDLGMKTKDVDYYARLDDRAARSKTAMDNLGKDIFGNPRDEKRSSSASTATSATKKSDPVSTITKADELTVPEPPKSITSTDALGPVGGLDEGIKKDPDKAGKGEGLDAPTEPDTGAGTSTAKGGEEEAAKLEEIAGGEAEKKLADTVRKGRRSTIKTTPKGLLAQAPVRPRRSLLGGLLA